ncbi:MAG TPA: DinB family protein, partial [Burkholderiales bacterium]
TTTYNAPPPADVVSAKDIQKYGEDVTARLERWWSRLPDKSCRQKVKTYYGERSLHELLERCTWHSAQHARQMIAVLERVGVEPKGRLTAADYAGLPMPQGLWE